jgi:5-oxoprolinase (ATP-hydrolysing)
LITGPALIFDRRTTIVVDDVWEAKVDDGGAVVMNLCEDATRQGTEANAVKAGRSEIVAQELFANRLTAIAADMGQMLQRTALSTNVKERLDFSCAVMDAHGGLAVNAPHIPVHLGAMGMCVRAVRDVIDMEPGDVIVTNHPRYGGTHLPDITVITPVFVSHVHGIGSEEASAGQRESEDSELIGYVASRAHHAELGGTRPGSMPPNATKLIEEGVVIGPQYLIRAGKSRFDEIERLLTGSPHPSRAVADNLADLRAAVAANERGRQALVRLARQCSVGELGRRMHAMTDRASRMTLEALRVRAGRSSTTERLDDGSLIKVAIAIETDGRAVVDFTGSAAQHHGNLNATPAIVHSATMYVLRLVSGKDVPLNEGMMRAVELRIPTGSMLNPHFADDASHCPAVVGGNTETSQRIVDTLIKALGLAACSQGTMNNVLFGSDRFSYYETICGGAGAGEGFNGADAVHTHMTNTRITDPEIIEHRYPARLERFAIRRGSGGAGMWRGGDGVVREMTFLQPMSLSVLTQHRIEQPHGIGGGEPGAVGRQFIIRASGEVVPLQPIDACDVKMGDRLVVETPGGGGAGPVGRRRQC